MTWLVFSYSIFCGVREFFRKETDKPTNRYIVGLLWLFMATDLLIRLSEK